MRYILTLVLFLLIQIAYSQSRINRAITNYNLAKEAYQQGDYSGFLDQMIKADSLLPFSRPIKYNLAAAYSMNGLFQKSYNVIDQLILIDTNIPFNEDSVFSKLKTDNSYSKYLKKVDQQNEEISNSQVAFEIEEIDLHPESVTFDPGSGFFYISSMRKRKVVRYDPKDQTVEDWITTADLRDLYGVMGMKVSPDGNYLWLCSSPLPEMEGFDNNGRYTPSVFKISLSDKSKYDQYALPVDAVPGDLVLSENGNCYVSDSAIPRIFMIKKNRAQIFYDGQETLVNLQGITLNKNTLFIADYLLGVHWMSLTDKEPQPVSIDPPNNLAGVDGLYFYQNSLITVQNGVYHYRIGRYYLDDQNKILNFEFYEKASEYLDEPTLGVITDDRLYFVANSPWKYYEESRLLTDKIKTPQIRYLDLQYD